MSRDIRSFFSVIPKKSSTDSAKTAPPPVKKKPKRLVESDDEDIILGTPEQKQQKPTGKKQKVITISSDSEDETNKKSPKKNLQKSPSKAQKIPDKIEILSSDSEDEVFQKKAKEPEKKKPEGTKLKPATLTDIFKNTPIKQSKVKAPEQSPKQESDVKKAVSRKKNVKDKEKKVHNDTDFEKTLDLDDDLFESHLDELEKTISEVEGQNGSTKAETHDTNKEEQKNPRKRSRTDSPERATPKKTKIEHVDSGIDPGQEAHEKRRYSAMLYQKYLNRTGPKNHGKKELPKGKPNCLNNLCFLRTGVLDSLESEEFDQLIKEHGGRTVHTVSKKVNYLVVGEEPGPAKLAKAESFNIPRISEDELLDLILVKSGMEAKYCKKSHSGSSEDLGIESDHEENISSKEKQPEEVKEKKEKKIESSKSKEKKENISSKEKQPEKIKEKEEKKIEPSKSKEKKENISSKEKQSVEIKEKKENLIDSSKSKEKKENGLSKKFEKNITHPKKSPNKESTSISNKPSTSKVIQPNEKPSVNEEDNQSLPLTEKYKPQSLKGIIGQQGEKSSLHKLKNWLANWHKNQSPKVKKVLVKPSPWAKSDDGAYFKCALLSGAPGVGKTTSATLVAKELGLDIVEFNASDTRSKRSLQEEVSQLLHNQTIAGFATGKSKITSRRVLLMDEVDGMAGNEDRGGIQELIQLIKNTSVPIICMCNDRNHQKMRSLVNYCFDLRFTKPKLEQIRGAMMSVCFKEKIDISAQALSEIISATGCDVRQTLNHLALLGSTKEKITTEVAEKEAKSSKKDIVMGPWEVCRAVFTKSDQNTMTVADKARLFFYDYSLGPLFVQENYLKVQPEGANAKESLLKAAFAASCISFGDVVDAKIRRNNNWALLETQAFFSSVLPGHYMSGGFTGQINFPGWLGKNSKKGKFKRMLSELQAHARLTTGANKMAVRLDYLVPLRDAIITPLKMRGLEGVDEAVSVVKAYNLLREDVDNLVELSYWTSKQNLMKSIDSKVKSAFTRAYNKQVTLLPYTPASAVTKKKAAAAESDILGVEEEAVSDNESDDDITKNSMIKIRKGKGKKKDGEPGTSKKTATKKGRGKKAK